MKNKLFLLIACLWGLGNTSMQAQTNVTVTSIGDNGTGSLRQAITDANNNGGGTIIVGSSLARKTILLESVLPEITQKYPIMRIQDGAAVTARRIHFTGGKAEYYNSSQSDWNYMGGGAVCSLRTLVLHKF
jgi:type IV secretory pathway ATPase VirB11/archaellum biosynthesis ATPase